MSAVSTAATRLEAEPRDLYWSFLKSTDDQDMIKAGGHDSTNCLAARI